MKRIRKSPAVRAFLLYLLLTAGLIMLLYSYTNFYNRLNEDSVTPVSIEFSNGRADVRVIDRKAEFELSEIEPDNKEYFMLYIAMPDEIRAGIVSLYAFFSA